MQPIQTRPQLWCCGGFLFDMELLHLQPNTALPLGLLKSSSHTFSLSILSVASLVYQSLSLSFFRHCINNVFVPTFSHLHPVANVRESFHRSSRSSSGAAREDQATWTPATIRAPPPLPPIAIQVTVRGWTMCMRDRGVPRSGPRKQRAPGEGSLQRPKLAVPSSACVEGLGWTTTPKSLFSRRTQTPKRNRDITAIRQSPVHPGPAVPWAATREGIARLTGGGRRPRRRCRERNPLTSRNTQTKPGDPRSS